MVQLHEVTVGAQPLAVLRPLIGDDRFTRLEDAAGATKRLLGDRIVWNINSTASGGGVAEMLRVLVGYIRGAGIDGRWTVIEGDPAFFAITKRLHNRLHGMRGDAGALGPTEVAHYASVTAANAEALLTEARPGDVVLLHDPQTAGMAPSLADAGVTVIWRCHIGTDQVNSWTEEAWGLLRPYLSNCKGFVFSRQAYAPPWIPKERLSVIAPSIDPFSPKNQHISEAALPDFLARIGLTSTTSQAATFVRSDGTSDEITHHASILGDGPLAPDAPLVLQVSRWDRLKDMHGVMMGFASGVVRPAGPQAQLILAGPSVEGVADDPEGAEVLAECVASWEALPPVTRRHVHLVTLPMIDVEENASMVNALQRSATVIVQKSLAEGFGLTVAEGMWKGKPVVASRLGGIIDQVVPGTGILLDDPTDLDAYAEAVATLLDDPAEISRLGENARRRVLSEFVGDRHLLRYTFLIERLLTT